MLGADLRDSDSFFENGTESDGERPRESPWSTSRQFGSGIFLDAQQLTLATMAVAAVMAEFTARTLGRRDLVLTAGVMGAIPAAVCSWLSRETQNGIAMMSGPSGKSR